MKRASEIHFVQNPVWGLYFSQTSGTDLHPPFFGYQRSSHKLQSFENGSVTMQ